MCIVVPHSCITSGYVFLPLHKQLQCQKHADIYTRTHILPQLLYSTTGDIGSITSVHLVLLFVRQRHINLIHTYTGSLRTQEITVYTTWTSTYVTYVHTPYTSHNSCQDSLTVRATRQIDIVLTPTDSGVRNFKSGFRVCNCREN